MYILKFTYATESTCTQELKYREIVRMARTLDGMADRGNELQEAHHNKGDNNDSLEIDLTQTD